MAETIWATLDSDGSSVTGYYTNAAPDPLPANCMAMDISDARMVAYLSAQAAAALAASQVVYIPTATVLGRLTTAEYTAIMQAAAAQLASGDGQLALWIDMARTAPQGINPADATTTAARAALIAADLLTSDRDAVVFAAP